MGTEAALPPLATCGHGLLPGNVWRPGDPVKHLGPPESLGIELWSKLFQTRCGLTAADGQWREVYPNQNDDVWCRACLSQAGIPHREEEW